MKKTLVALATLAVAAGASAQSSVTIYGAIDAGVYSLNHTSATTDSGAMIYGDSSLVSSIWGLRGSEDLGGGMKAIFNAESDIQTNNGGLNHNGLFRRAANLGLSADWGTVEAGVKINPIIATNAALMPVSGNSVSTVTSTAFSYADFFTKNALTYTSPTVLGGLVAQIQRGFGNTTGDSTAGSVTAWSLNYTNGPLSLRAAAQDRKEGGTNASSNASISSSCGSTSVSATSPGLGTSQGACFNKRANILGASYVIGQFTIAAANIKSSNATALAGAYTDRTGNQFGVAYQLNAQTLLGASQTRAEGSTLTNMQARYDLSKRSTLYFNYGKSVNSADGKINFTPIALNTGGAPGVSLTNAAGTAAWGGVTSLDSAAYGVGMIHRF